MWGYRSYVGIGLLIAGLGLAWVQGAVGQVGLKSTTVLQTTTTTQGQSLQFPSSQSQFTGLLLEIAPGGRIGRHRHPVPNLAYVLEGELTIEADGQPTRTYRPGEAFSEGDYWHDGINNGSVPVKVWVVFAGAVGTPLTVRP